MKCDELPIYSDHRCRKPVEVSVHDALKTVELCVGYLCNDGSPCALCWAYAHLTAHLPARRSLHHEVWQCSWLTLIHIRQQQFITSG